jgi:hypothetical protein
MYKRSFFQTSATAALIGLCLIGCLAFTEHPSYLRGERSTLHVSGKPDIAKRLHDLADKKMKAAKIVMPTDAKASVDELIDQGADALTKESATESQIKTAEDNLGKFIDGLIANGEGLRGNVTRVNKNAVKKTKRSLCPLFPFC